MTRGQEALQRLREGNERYVSEASRGESFLRRMLRRAQTVTTQEPFAIILGCSDSRVPVEIVLDQDLGDLFVIRVAGNIVAPSQLGSVEYAVEQFGTPLVLVMGHESCGAIMGTLEQLKRPTAARSPNMRFVANCIRPAVAHLLDPALHHDRGALIREGVRANVRQSVEQLRTKSKILQPLVASGELLVAGAEYSLATGRVSFLEEPSRPAAAHPAMGPRSHRKTVG